MLADRLTINASCDIKGVRIFPHWFGGSMTVARSSRSSRQHSVVSLAVILLVMGLASAAQANIMGGRRSPDADYLDGTGANVAGYTFHPGNGDCMIFSVLVFSSGSLTRQLQAGLVRCLGSNIALDGTCDGVRFVEKYKAPDDYVCFPHGAFDNGTHYYFNVKRDDPNSGRFHVHLGPNQTEVEGLDGFGTDNVIMYAWGEWTGGGTNCSAWDGSGNFDGWQKFVYGNGWNYIHGTVFGSCWNVSTIDDYGDFSVSN